MDYDWPLSYHTFNGGWGARVLKYQLTHHVFSLILLFHLFSENIVEDRLKTCISRASAGGSKWYMFMDDQFELNITTAFGGDKIPGMVSYWNVSI